MVGDLDGTTPAPQKALQDTIWIADWTFDTGAPCDESGWTHVDNRVRFTGDTYWHIFGHQPDPQDRRHEVSMERPVVQPFHRF